MAVAHRGGGGAYAVDVTERVGDPSHLLPELRQRAGRDGSVLVGFDFPIGFPKAYAEKVGIDNFVQLLPELGRGRWADFYRVAERPDEISLGRPFYPQRPGGTSQAHLLRALGVGALDDLRRRCERAHAERRAACPLFWTLGGQQVGKAAISGWRDLLGPALQSSDDLVLWPFAGTLEEIIGPGRIVVAETYPGEAYGHLGITFAGSRRGERAGKRVQRDRRANAVRIQTWARDAGVELREDARAEIDDGFGTGRDGEDRFDALVGLLGMLEVVLGRRPAGAPSDETVRRIEGWILGQGERRGKDL